MLKKIARKKKNAVHPIKKLATKSRRNLAHLTKIRILKNALKETNVVKKLARRILSATRNKKDVVLRLNKSL